MLRASSKAVGERIDVVDAVSGADDPIPHGSELLAFVDAVVGGDPVAGDSARAALAAAAGGAAIIDAAAVLANFEMMTRVADATGAVQLPERLATLVEVRERLGLDRFDSVH